MKSSGKAGRLTAREREVLQRFSGGKTDRDIAELLGNGPRAVHKHLQRIYEKLGVETRTAAVARTLGSRDVQESKGPEGAVADGLLSQLSNRAPASS